MKLYRLSLELPKFYTYTDPDRDAITEAFASSVKEWLESLPNVSLESWSAARYYGQNIVICDVEQLAEILCSTHKFSEFKESPTSEGAASFSVSKVELFYDRERVEDKMVALIERMELAALRLESGNPDRNPENPGWNSKTNSPLSGFHLHNANDLLLLEDCCTDSLQSYLDEGWRIIAVTTQEQRRPDYILARYNNTYNCERGRALRS